MVLRRGDGRGQKKIDEHEMTLARKSGIDLAPLVCLSTSGGPPVDQKSARE